jgi:hypothetical protein
VRSPKASQAKALVRFSRSDADPIGRSLRYRQYPLSQGFTPFFIVLVIELVLVLDGLTAWPRGVPSLTGFFQCNLP